MRKHIFGRQLKRDRNERKALFKSLMSALVIKESIQTTEAKAKSIKGEIEKLVTKAKKNAQEAERLLMPYFAAPVLKKFVTDIAPRFANRQGGYTRLIKLGNRFGDNSSMVMMEWVEKSVKADKDESAKVASKATTTTLEATTAVAKEDKKSKKEVRPVKETTVKKNMKKAPKKEKK